MVENAQGAAHASVPPRPPPAPARQTLQTEERAAAQKREDAQLRAAQRDSLANAEPPIIEVPNNFRARKGTRVGDGWQIGAALGTGLQARPRGALCCSHSARPQLLCSSLQAVMTKGAQTGEPCCRLRACVCGLGVCSAWQWAA